MKEENKIVENTNVENGLLFNAEITYTKEICKKAYKLLCKKQLKLTYEIPFQNQKAILQI